MLENYPELFKDKSGLTGNGLNSGMNSSKAGESCDIPGPGELEKAHWPTKAHQSPTLAAPPSSPHDKNLREREEQPHAHAKENRCPILESSAAVTAAHSDTAACDSGPSRDDPSLFCEK
ncbi:unnamed protein product [Microthlaspi erraticum]|uniref:Uncharacterized protein n=1 Tax=Microthlaspi erraticum TaxID=1685480 RepID=A0A6D2K6X3_9BRAS|nr:unnamed protein product [Microthlaspi erraticum]CAA7056527.1 unnamed protein product [Microthlaspi erraticum]